MNWAWLIGFPIAVTALLVGMAVREAGRWRPRL